MKNKHFNKYAQSWVGTFIKDAYTENIIGLVHDYKENEQGKLEIYARFPGETVSRKILLEVPEDPHDIEFLVPGRSRGRYRALSQEDKNLLRTKIRKNL